MEYGDLRLPSLTHKQEFRLLRKHFPRISFGLYNEKNILEITHEVLNKYIQFSSTGRPYLDIPKMAKDKLPILPDNTFTKKHSTILIRALKSGRHIDIVNFYLKKYDEKFAYELNKRMKKIKCKSKIISGNTLTKAFLTHIDKEEITLCEYSWKTNKYGEFEEKFIWNFPQYGLSMHEIKSIYDAFYNYAQKYCTLYLFGAECDKFKISKKKYIIPKKNQTLLEFFSKDKKKYIGLEDKFSEINVGDFVWKKPPVKEKIFPWNEIENKEYLLGRFGLDKTLAVSLKEIYHSFCLPGMNRKGYSRNINDRYYEIGNDLIEYTLQRKPWLCKKIDKYRTVWGEIINKYLESSPDGDFCPVRLEKYIEQVAGQVDFLEKEEAKALAPGGEFFDKDTREWLPGGRVLDDPKRRDIKNFFNKYRAYIPKDIEEEMHEKYFHKELYVLLEKLYSWSSLPENRAFFQDNAKKQQDYETIEALYHEIKTGKIQVKDGDKDGESKTKDVEDTKTPDPKDGIIYKEEKSEEEEFVRKYEPILKNFLVDCFRREFHGETKWIKKIQEMNIDDLYKGLKEYPPINDGSHHKNSFLYGEYQKFASGTVLNHTEFVKKIREIINDMINKNFWLEEK
jgi:hypothetical protein